ncbi:YceI family protein [Kineobactrum salinum]|uniref:YceI family protein n=1 Tax=Kineobactrum salinum TaxID=2708301 RepID=A0A6C0U0X4_9GAMM|nr:YceI family protein [Kineobactrum salinum]QIB65772.1 YceI family protein [Kineobactrum salinum]
MHNFNQVLRATVLGAALLGPGLGSQAALAADYVIDREGAHASINFKIQHLGYSWLTGRFNDFNGTFSYDPDDVAASEVAVEIVTGSVDSNHAERDKHLRGEDFLNVAKYPQARFVSTEIRDIEDDGSAFDVVGEFTLNGVTRPVTMEVEKVGAGEDPWGGYRVGFAGKAELPLKEFGIDFDLGPAAQVVELELHVEGVRQ